MSLRRIILHLVALHLRNTEIIAFGVAEVKAGDGGAGPHGVAFGECYAGCRLGVQKAEEGFLFRVVGLGGIAECGRMPW